MKLLNSIIRFWHRCVLAIIVEDVRRTEAKFTELEAELKRHLEAVVFLSNTKRDSQGLRGSVPELLCQ